MFSFRKSLGKVLRLFFVASLIATLVVGLPPPLAPHVYAAVDYSFISDEVLVSTAYDVRVATAQAPLSGLNLVAFNAAQPANGNTSATTNDPINDIADSDAAISGANAVIAYMTGSGGVNSHGLDMGFSDTPATINEPVFCSAALDDFSEPDPPQALMVQDLSLGGPIIATDTQTGLVGVLEGSRQMDLGPSSPVAAGCKRRLATLIGSNSAPVS